MTAARDWLFERFAEAQIALMTLTRLPAGHVRAPVPDIAAATWAFPLMGLLVGGISAAGYAVAHAANLPPALAALVAIAFGIAVTGALHEDGLADTADGLGGGRDLEKKLAIMRDSHVGSYGVLVLILSVAVRAVCIATVAAPIVVAGASVALAVASRTAMVVALYAMPPARPDGLGRSATGVTRSRCTVACLLGLAALVVLVNVWPVVALGMMAVGLFVGYIAWRQLRGQSGDILGAIQQSTEVAGWAVIVSWHSGLG